MSRPANQQYHNVPAAPWPTTTTSWVELAASGATVRWRHSSQTRSSNKGRPWCHQSPEVRESAHSASHESARRIFSWQNSITRNKFCDEKVEAIGQPGTCSKTPSPTTSVATGTSRPGGPRRGGRWAGASALAEWLHGTALRFEARGVRRQRDSCGASQPIGHRRRRIRFGTGRNVVSQGRFELRNPAKLPGRHHSDRSRRWRSAAWEITQWSIPEFR